MKKKRPKTLKFYIAGSFIEKRRMKKLMNEVKKRGYQITADWTAHSSIKPYEENLSLAQKYSKEDIDGVKNCDVFVLFPRKEGGSTQFTEFGVAIISKKVKRIFVVGPHNTRSMAFFHPKVKRVDSFKEVFKKLR